MKKLVSRFLYYSVSFIMLFGLFQMIQGCSSVSTGTQKATPPPQLKPISASQPSLLAKQRYPQMDDGLRLEKENKLEEALTIYQKVASEMPNFADVYARMAYTLRKMGYARQSYDMLHKCIKIGGFKRDSFYAMDANFSADGRLYTDSISIKAPTEEKELLETKYTAEAMALMFSSGGYWILMMTKQGDSVPIIDNTPTITIGFELRFDRGDWVEFLSKHYRKGGVRVLKTGLEFVDGTEQLDNGAVKVLRSGKWVKE